MTNITKNQAIKALEGMRTIVHHEMLMRGAYVDNEISNPRLKGAICGGRKHCAIGSLWVGAGVKPQILPHGIDLPGTGSEERDEFLRPRHGLRLAYDKLNEAARGFAKDNMIKLRGGEFDADIEQLFEGHYGSTLTKRDMLKIISAAKRKVIKA